MIQFPRYEIRFRNYEKAKEELIAVRSLVQSAESGISPDRKVTEIEVAPHGDAILEFANHHADMNPNDPVMRFRVSSQMLSETSPVFARIFSSSNLQSLYVYDDDDINVYLPPAPTRYTCRDGSEARVFRMPQLELNYLQSFEILLYAAHMKPEKVPKDITFEQFVAVAESCNRYKCTSPLERVVEDLWLPQWMRNGADDMADGMVVISYAFGLRTLFTRMSKSAILNLVDERDLQSKPWPQTIKSKLWAVRCAKMAQVYMCCTSAIQEYLPTPSRNPTDEIQPIAPSELRSNSRVPSSLPKPIASSPSALSTTPRCPKGSHACDAGNLGWIMLVFNELNVLSQVLRPTVLSHRPDAEREPSRSLAQIVEALRRIPSPLSPMHRGGVCDPSPAFRSAVNDIYNSVTGLTLHDVSGKSHGWALSRHFASEPDDLGSWGMERMAVNDRNHHSVATEFPENVRLKVLSYVDDLDDLHTAAMLNHLWYDTYITHERYLLRNIVRASYTRGAYAAGALHEPKLPKSISNAEEKVLKSESEQLRVERRGSVNMSESGDDEDDYESDAESDASSDNTPAPSISESIRRDIRLRPSASKKFTAAVAAAATTYSAASRPRPMPPPGSMGIILDSSGTTPRQSPPLSPSDASSLSESDQEKSSSTVSHTEYNDEPPMTEEEARHILWPNASDDDSARRAQASRQAQLGEGLREKFLADDKLLLEVLGDKRPEFTEDKRLLTEEQRATRADR